MNKTKSEKWYAAMAARRGNCPNQFTKAKRLGLPIPAGSATGKPGTFKGRNIVKKLKRN